MKRRRLPGSGSHRRNLVLPFKAKRGCLKKRSNGQNFEWGTILKRLTRYCSKAAAARHEHTQKHTYTENKLIPFLFCPCICLCIRCLYLRPTRTSCSFFSCLNSCFLLYAVNVAVLTSSCTCACAKFLVKSSCV